MACSRKISTAKADKADCDRKLGKPPPVPPQPKDLLSISDSVVERLQTERKPIIINEDQRTAYEDYWIEKLKCLDKSHTVRNQLDIDAGEKILQSLLNFSQNSPDEPCPYNKDAVIECYSSNKGRTLKCSTEVKSFIDCIDKLFYDALHVNSAGPNVNRKASYAEKFNRGY